MSVISNKSIRRDVTFSTTIAEFSCHVLDIILLKVDVCKNGAENKLSRRSNYLMILPVIAVRDLTSYIVPHSGIVILIITKFNLITVAINNRSKRN